MSETHLQDSRANPLLRTARVSTRANDPIARVLEANSGSFVAQRRLSGAVARSTRDRQSERTLFCA